MICDYFLIRRTRLEIDDLYDPRGRYAGINWVAMVALLIAVIPNVPGFINAATNTAGTVESYFAPIWDTIYTYAWFVGFALGSVIYVAGMTAAGTSDHESR